MMYEKMHNLIPPGSKGDVSITHFEVGERDAAFSRMREAATGGREQAVRVGKYVRLTVNGTLMMTDTQMEQRTNMDLLHAARGNVLIAGLGIGMVLPPVLQKPEVDTVLVVEKSQDVIDLVGPHLEQRFEDRLFIFQGDIFTWTPEPSWSFDVIYFDIWPTITADNLSEMEDLRESFEPYLKPKGWMGSWCERECSMHSRRRW